MRRHSHCPGGDPATWPPCSPQGATAPWYLALSPAHTWVVAALKEMPSSEQSPRPEATERATSRTPARPTAPWDLEQSHRSMVTQA